MPYSPVGPCKLFYSIHNPNDPRGPFVLLLHGLGSCGDDWLLQLPALTPNYRVMTLDLRGHGRSGVSLGRPTIADWTHDVASLLKTFGESETHVVGLSLGGTVALQLAIDWPDLVRSLTLVNTFARIQVGHGGRLHAAGRMILLAFGHMGWMGRWVASALFPDDGQKLLREVAGARIASNPRGSYLRSLGAAARFNVRSRLCDIVAPTLVVAGDRDTIVPVKAKMELANRIPRARLEVVRGSGHATPVDAPEVFNRLLLDFLNEIDAEANYGVT
jgi:3-oxoadipate enol-lactonase